MRPIITDDDPTRLRGGKEPSFPEPNDPQRRNGLRFVSRTRRRIIHPSRSLIEADPVVLDAIVAESIAWNIPTGITGMLWWDGANFAQAIAGGHDEIGITMDRIRSDPRHTDIDVIPDRAILSRQFGDWAMRRAGDGKASTPGTTFLLGFALSRLTASTKRLYAIVLATER